jgi:anti-sigma B factor antagonist
MTLDFTDENDSLRRITLTGRLDIAGTEAIATRFSALCASAERRVVVDLSSVSFLSSIGIRALVGSAKAQQQRGGRMVLVVEANSSVAKTLETTGIDALIPMFTDSVEAEKAALG